MADLTHWDFADDFSGIEVAALIVGTEPTLLAPLGGTEFLPASINPVLARVRKSYEAAWSTCLFSTGLELDEPFSPEPGPKDLKSIDMVRYIDTANEEAMTTWLQNRERSGFAAQRFSRQEVSRWLSATGLSSQYLFVLRSQLENRQLGRRPNHWPWGTHHTELLGHLEAAASRFWVNYDPDEPSTMVTNETVSKWLQSERRVSKTMADAIASILRLDGLQPGPRPK